MVPEQPEYNFDQPLVIPGGKRFILRNDGYRVYARLEGSDPNSEVCVFEYKHSDHEDAFKIVLEILLRASIAHGRDELNLESNAGAITPKTLQDGYRETLRDGWSNE